jgi:uncharacterized RDD family membrane protein YckC
MASESIVADPTPSSLEAHPDLARLQAALTAPQAALRARLNAIVLDLLLLGVVSQVLVDPLVGAHSRTDRAWTFLVVEFVYFFVCELRNGRTVGKRIFHVRVVATDGGRITWRQIATRNLVRIADALPLLYVSGLLSMIKTGPSRRQRMGDVAAKTTVVLDNGGKPLRTPSWLLPALALFTTGLSILAIVALANASASGQRVVPHEGSWQARMVTIGSTGYANQLPASARWTIARKCVVGSSCQLVLTVEDPGEPAGTTVLVPEARAWLAAFPVHSSPCGTQGGQTLYRRQASVIGLRFTDGGRAAEGEERVSSESTACGGAYAERSLSAQLTSEG